MFSKKIRPEGVKTMFDENRLRDPGFFRENRLDPHSDHRTEPAYRLSLNGFWKFAHAEKPADVIQITVRQIISRVPYAVSS